MVGRIQPLVYTLDLPANLRIHNVFHTGVLKPWVPGKTSWYNNPAPIVIDDVQEFVVETILNARAANTSRRILSGRTIINRWEYLVNWQGYGAEHNSWEPEVNLRRAAQKIKEYWGRESPAQPTLGI